MRRITTPSWLYLLSIFTLDSINPGTSMYAYDGDNLVEEINSFGAVVARYEDTQNIDGPSAMLRNSALGVGLTRHPELDLGELATPDLRLLNSG
jgi:hypothetical protein